MSHESRNNQLNKLFNDLQDPDDQSNEEINSSNKNLSPAECVARIAFILNQKPSIKKKLTEAKIIKRGKSEFITFLKEFYPPSVDESKF